jgi:hypothetical protein
MGDRRFGRSAALLLDRLAAPPPAAASRWALPDVRLRPPRHTRTAATECGRAVGMVGNEHEDAKETAMP